MEMESHFIPGDPILVDNIVSHLKAIGIFDEIRQECLADVDTKSSYQNLSQRVDLYTAKFLANETYNPDLCKNEVRNKLRKHIDESDMLATGADHVVEQVMNPKIQELFLPKIIDVVHEYLDKEKEKLNKKQDIIDSQKISTEAITKTKTPVFVGSLKKEDSSVIAKHSSEKHDENSKQTSHYFSSYDSSQGSDPPKHFSKHQTKDSSTIKPSSSKKQSDSDSGTPKKNKGQRSLKYPTVEQRKSFTVQESSKITSRTNSIGSVSSTDVNVSSVHTSDLSSYDDKVSDVECSKNEPAEGKSKKRFTFKEAEEILKAKVEQQRLDALKTVSQKALDDKKNLSSPQNSATAVALSEIESSPPPEPKREPRRERKLNPKYASSDYTSIFDSKRMSFITKQSTQNEVKPADVKKTKADVLPAKDTTATKRKSSVTTPDKTDASSSVPSSESAEISPPPEPKRESRRERKLNRKYASSEYTSIFDSKRTSFITKQSTQNEVKPADAKKTKVDLLPAKDTTATKRNATSKDPNGHGTNRKIRFQGERFC